MGVDTKAIIRNSVTLTNIVDALSKNYTDVNVLNTSIETYFVVLFNDGSDRRKLSVHYGNIGFNDYGIPGVLVSLGYWRNSVLIMKYLLNYFGGGCILENDCEDDWQYTGPENITAPIELTKEEEFTHKVIAKVGYSNLKSVMSLLEEYKSL